LQLEHLYFEAICLQWLHLTISTLAHFGHINLVEPIVFVILLLHELQTACFSVILVFGIRILFKNVVVLCLFNESIKYIIYILSFMSGYLQSLNSRIDEGIKGLRTSSSQAIRDFSESSL